MPPGKRELARIERRLVTTLTDACETAKSEMKGFTWLTHTADLNALAQTLKVTWVFETLADKNLAQAGAKARVFVLIVSGLGIGLFGQRVFSALLKRTDRCPS